MASHSAVTSVYAQLAASVADEVEITGFPGRIEVMNVSGSAPIVIKNNSVPSSAAPPLEDYIILPAVAGASFIFEELETLYESATPGSNDTTMIGLFSTGTPTYTVTKLPGQKRVRA